MLSVKSPSLVLPRCFAVVILCLSLTPSQTSKASEIGWSALVSAGSADVVAFAAAAEQNARLKLDLNWTFGAKTQRGWYLYVPSFNASSTQTASLRQTLSRSRWRTGRDRWDWLRRAFSVRRPGLRWWRCFSRAGSMTGRPRRLND